MAPITLGMKVWLEVKALEIVDPKEEHRLPEERATLNGLLLFQNSKKIVSDPVSVALLKRSFTTLEDAIILVRLGIERKESLKAENQHWFEEEVIRLLDEGIKKSPNKEILSLFDELLRHPEMKTLSPHAKGKCLHLISKERGANAEDFGLSSAHLEMIKKASGHAQVKVKPLEVSIHRTARERMKGGLDEMLTEALSNIQAYIGTLAHNAAGCSTCGAQSCSGGDGVDTGCPGGKNINTINTTLQQLGQINGRLSRAQWAVLRKAFELQIKKTPFIFYTGAACPAPCESACTETIPDLGLPNPKRAGKRVGEETHIKKIELHLDQIGHALGWYDDEKEIGGAKEWTDDEIRQVFGNRRVKEETYNVVMKDYTPAFRCVSDRDKKSHLRLDIVGSGPAAMEMARLALLDGVDVHIFEKSNRPGGLLADGIPPHKYDKKRIDAHFRSLEKMGLHLHLNSEVKYDASTGFYVEAEGSRKCINDATNPNHYVALCVGAGKPKQLRDNVIEGLIPEHRKKIVQGVHFLKKASDVAIFCDDNPELTDDDKREYIQREMGDMSPFGKKIAVIGGGDTAQDAVRTLARFFNLELDVHRGYLTILIRGPQLLEARGLGDSYPKQSKTPTPENRLRFEELGQLKELQKHADGDSHYLVEPTRIEAHPSTGKLSIHMKQSAFKHHDLIDKDEELKVLAESLPREAKPLVQSSMTCIEDVDMVICALGFEGQESIKIIQDTTSMERVYIAGDAAYVKPHIIIGAQSSAHDTYLNKIRAALGLHDEQPTLARSVGKSPLLSVSLFGQKRHATDAVDALPSGRVEAGPTLYASF
jgi:NADPH-dependent glutamate synthase beta subunit-like oxidoreductase